MLFFPSVRTLYHVRGGRGHIYLSLIDKNDKKKGDQRKAVTDLLAFLMLFTASYNSNLELFRVKYENENPAS